MEIKAIIFDLDGTLFDSIEDIVVEKVLYKNECRK
ncbi:phosphoglycolate phosphatase [Saccharicrinis fermentans DSM 9555 = JCM 21142]|uniref:Phosphoglycolate phosphatase n=1 Tax=Saccharicrinis fermentans DSM 9555 = JCM 21142 TaxID=869213 RepID=W7YHA8_9BACT|nr:phosphoglycolate phosphatase [Saccharicrinis fermentans DSM 9555 = JCM 21142]